MHSLSLKEKLLPGRVGHGLEADLDFERRRRVWLGCWHGGAAGGRECRILACAVERNGNGGGGDSPSFNPNSTQNQSSFLSRNQTYAMLKQQMEDYKEAARIRDSLKMFEEEEPVLRLRRLIEEAVADERFEDAARYHDEMKEIAPHSLLKCSSEATTLGDWSYRRTASYSSQNRFRVLICLPIKYSQWQNGRRL
ncbi:hypothetical protein CRYUN_Cryun13aG0050500 [Craigia yunnanensis]